MRDLVDRINGKRSALLVPEKPKIRTTRTQGREERINKAIAIMKACKGQIGVKELAAQCGYSDYRALGYAFKKQTGLTVLQFRDRQGWLPYLNTSGRFQYGEERDKRLD